MVKEGELLTQSDGFLAGTLEHLLPLASDSDGDLTQYLFIHCCSVTKSWLTPCDPMHWSTLGYPVLHYLPELAQTRVHWVSDVIQPKHVLLPQSPPALNLPALGSFPRSWLVTSSGQSIGASASSPVIPIHNQGWFPLGLTGLISLQSKGLSSLLQHHNSKASILWHSAFFMIQLLHPYMTTGKSSDYMDLFLQSDVFVYIHMFISLNIHTSVQFHSVTQSCPTLCNPMNHSTPGLPVHHQLLEFTQTHVHQVSDAPAISSSVIPFRPQSLQASGSFPMSQLFAWGGQSIGVSASASWRSFCTVLLCILAISS